MRLASSLIALALVLPSMASAQNPAATPAPAPPPENLRSAAEALAAAPKAIIGNGVLRAVLLLPEQPGSFYRGTRFDRGGIVASLTWGEQEYYGLWFDKTASNVRDFIFHAEGVIAGPNTAIVGPAEAFDPGGPASWASAAPGAGFLKIGVGILRKPTDGAGYSSFRTYEVIDPGVWRVRAFKDRVEFEHRLSDAATGYGYTYRKTIRLLPGRPKMRIEHSLTNTGAQPLTTTMFNHNFLTLGGAPAREGFTLETPYEIRSSRPPRAEAAVIEGRKVRYLRPIPDGQSVTAAIEGFGPTAADNRFTVTAPDGAGYSVEGDRPLAQLALWSIRTNVSVEPFVAIAARPGETTTWNSTYTYLRPAR